MLPADFRQQLVRGVLDQLWPQWSILGVAGEVGEINTRLIIDPEAILAALFLYGRYDARLFDEVMDWLLINGDMINVPRLRAILEIFAVAEADRVFQAVSRYLAVNATQRTHWKHKREPVTVYRENLFRNVQGESLPAPGNPDEIFEQSGFLRERVCTRGMSGPFPKSGANTLLLQFRAMFGASCRCELICALAAYPNFSASEAARFLAYRPRTIQQALSEMSRTGWVHAHPLGREIRYSLDRRFLTGLSSEPSLDFPPTVYIYKTLCAILDSVNHCIARKSTSAATVAILRKKVKELVLPMARVGVTSALQDTIDADGEEFLTSLLNDCLAVADFHKTKNDRA